MDGDVDCVSKGRWLWQDPLRRPTMRGAAMPMRKMVMIIGDAGDGDPAIEGGEEVTGSCSCLLCPSVMRGVVTAMREAALGERNDDGDGVAKSFLHLAESSLVLDGNGEEEAGDG